MKITFILFEIILLIVSIPLLATGIIKKRHSMLYTGICMILAGNGLFFWILSGMVLEQRHISDSSISNRFKYTIEEINHPYDPCTDTDMDGPIRIHHDHTAMRNIIYKDFILLYDPNIEIPIFPLTQSSSPETFFSLSRAAHHIRQIIVPAKPDHDNQWMIQFTGISEVNREPAAEFIIGMGKLDFTCQNYFKIMSKVSVSVSGKIYKYRNDSPEFTETMTHKTIEGLTPDKDFGIALSTH